MDLSLLRNVAIIAHIDHGKSTLADRMLELCGAVDPRDMREQYLELYAAAAPAPVAIDRDSSLRARPLRILYHHRTQGRGAEGVHIASIVGALSAMGHQVTVLGPPGVDALATAGSAPGASS